MAEGMENKAARLLAQETVGGEFAATVVTPAVIAAFLVYEEMLFAASLYSQARLGFASGIHAAIRTMHQRGRGVLTKSQRVVKARTLLRTEADPEKRAALTQVATVAEQALASNLRSFFSEFSPSAHDMRHPGSWAPLRERFAPLIARQEVTDPLEISRLAADVLREIHWCAEHAADLQVRAAGGDPSAQKEGHHGEAEADETSEHGAAPQEHHGH